ncbi:hypothetical protein MPH_09785 [Macrophomina phaseolina MS6]|uniref:Uncharacterized protein n=1 Tax=Macrophomina phaseolina (strain MS6) TaxID=1126212 RepID=K2RES9_MACPH|nr:hypothetical protein MPH_09785 [Macrophomina phaseolina MS6]
MMSNNAANTSQTPTTAGPSTAAHQPPASEASPTPTAPSSVSPTPTSPAPASSPIPHSVPSGTVQHHASPVPVPANAPEQANATAENTRQKASFFQIQEEFWPWKLGLRTLALICAIVGMSTLIWVGVEEGNWSSSTYYSGDQWIGALSIPLICSVLFNAIAILILLLSKRPIHPGAAVGVDLVLWLTLVVTGFFTTWAYYTLISSYDYSSSSFYGYYSSDGTYRSSYYCSSDDYIYDPSDRTCTYSPSECPGYDSCEQRDAHDAAKYRRRILWVGAIFTWLCLVLHFILFVWACVDTHRRNRAKEATTAQIAAERIVQEMIATGQLVRPAPVFMRPPPHGMAQQQSPMPYQQGMVQTERPLPPIQEFYTPGPRGSTAGKDPEQV